MRLLRHSAGRAKLLLSFIHSAAGAKSFSEKRRGGLRTAISPLRGDATDGRAKLLLSFNISLDFSNIRFDFTYVFSSQFRFSDENKSKWKSRQNSQVRREPHPPVRVDWERFQKSMEIKELSADDQKWMEEVMNVELGYSTHGLDNLVPYARKAWESGRYSLVQRIDDYGRIVTRSFKAPQHGLVRSRAETNGKLDPGDAMQISALERRVREYIFETVQFFKEYLPGFENCYLHVVAPYLGARGGRWIEAEYPISGEDVQAGRRFDDVIYIYYDGRSGTATDIPYRSLIPKDVDGLIAAGRSAVPRSPNFRQRHSVLLMGQASGIAAALCVKNNVAPRNLNAKELQRILVQYGCPLGDEARLKELGLSGVFILSSTGL